MIYICPNTLFTENKIIIMGNNDVLNYGLKHGRKKLHAWVGIVPASVELGFNETSIFYFTECCI